MYRQANPQEELGLRTVSSITNTMQIVRGLLKTAENWFSFSCWTFSSGECYISGALGHWATTLFHGKGSLCCASTGGCLCRLPRPRPGLRATAHHATNQSDFGILLAFAQFQTNCLYYFILILFSFEDIHTLGTLSVTGHHCWPLVLVRAFMTMSQRCAGRIVKQNSSHLFAILIT